eukprot:763707-Hanusia_phi.AAC.3
MEEPLYTEVSAPKLTNFCCFCLSSPLLSSPLLSSPYARFLTCQKHDSTRLGTHGDSERRGEERRGEERREGKFAERMIKNSQSSLDRHILLSGPAGQEQAVHSQLSPSPLQYPAAHLQSSLDALLAFDVEWGGQGRQESSVSLTGPQLYLPAGQAWQVGEEDMVPGMPKYPTLQTQSWTDRLPRLEWESAGQDKHLPLAAAKNPSMHRQSEGRRRRLTARAFAGHGEQSSPAARRPRAVSAYQPLPLLRVESSRAEAFLCPGRVLLGGGVSRASRTPLLLPGPPVEPACTEAVCDRGASSPRGRSLGTSPASPLLLVKVEPFLALAVRRVAAPSCRKHARRAADAGASAAILTLRTDAARSLLVGDGPSWASRADF